MLYIDNNKLAQSIDHLPYLLTTNVHKRQKIYQCRI